MQRENRERNFNNTHRLKVGCVMRYSRVPWNPGFMGRKNGVCLGRCMCSRNHGLKKVICKK